MLQLQTSPPITVLQVARGHINTGFFLANFPIVFYLEITMDNLLAAIAPLLMSTVVKGLRIWAVALTQVRDI